MSWLSTLVDVSRRWTIRVALVCTSFIIICITSYKLMMMMMMMMTTMVLCRRHLCALKGASLCCRSGELCRSDGAIRDVSTQVPRCVRHRTSTVRHYRHISLQRLRIASVDGLVTVCLYVSTPLSVCNTHKYYTQATGFDGLFLLVAFHCIAIIYGRPM